MAITNLYHEPVDQIRDEGVKNLHALADLLDTVDEKAFTMWAYRCYLDDEENPDDNVYDLKEVNSAKVDASCGTAGCALGWAPMVKGLEMLPSDIDNLSTVYGRYWFDYSLRIFPGLSLGNEWDWCFSPSWKQVDNTPKGAAKRIRHMLKYGLPENAYEQEHGDDTLCYEPPEKYKFIGEPWRGQTHVSNRVS